MALKGLFRKKTVHDIMKQVEQNESDGHNALGKHLTARDLTAFGIAAIVGGPSINPETKGKNLFNSAFFLHEGFVEGLHTRDCPVP